jgi:hypothetical protein
VTASPVTENTASGTAFRRFCLMDYAGFKFQTRTPNQALRLRHHLWGEVIGKS